MDERAGIWRGGRKVPVAGGSAEFMLSDIWGITTTAAASKEQFGDSNTGLKTELQSDLTLSEHVSLSASATHFSNGYRELADALDDEFQPNDNTYSGNVSFASGIVGTFSAGFNYNQSANYEDSRYLLLSWGKALNMPASP